MEAQFLAELSERLFVHFALGRWCAPLGQRVCPVLTLEGGRVGRIVCADPADVDRALTGVRKAVRPEAAGGPKPAGPADAAELLAAWASVQEVARALRRFEGYDDTQTDVAMPMVPGAGPVVLLSAADAPLSALVGVLLAGAPRGVLWKPAPGAAASAHLVMRALGPLSGGALALVQGDHSSGAALQGKGAIVWASGGDAPPQMGAPVLRLEARAPRHR